MEKELTREEIISSPSMLAVYEAMGRELPGATEALVREEILPELRNLAESLRTLQSQVRALRNAPQKLAIGEVQGDDDAEPDGFRAENDDNEEEV
jgi:hypothetical protein